MIDISQTSKIQKTVHMKDKGREKSIKFNSRYKIHASSKNFYVNEKTNNKFRIEIEAR